MSSPYPTPGAQPPLPGGQPYPQAPVPKKRSFFARHKVLTALGAVVLLVVVIAVASSLGGGDPQAGPSGSGPAAASLAGAGSAPADSSDGSAGSATKPADAATQPAGGGDAAPLGTPVTDGAFEFTVTKVTPGVATVGTEPLTAQAQGQYVLVELSVKNVGDEAQYFSDTDQLLIDATGRQHSTDSTAAVYAGNSDSLLSKINPGNSVSGLLVFDIPADATPSYLELHSSILTDGVRAALS